MLGEFSSWMSNHQVLWRRQNLASQEAGWHGDRRREWVLPNHSWEEGLWPGIRSDGPCPVTSFLRGCRIFRQGNVQDLKSSLVHCANLYYPFSQSESGRNLITGFLRQHISAEIESVDVVEVAFTEPDHLHPGPLLGETGIHPQSRQTVADIGLVVNGGSGLVMFMSMFVESSFAPCPACRGRMTSSPANPDPRRCTNPFAPLQGADQCHLATWGRRYWDHLAPVANTAALAGLRCCPAASAGYQLVRQQALAEGIARAGRYEFVVLSLALDRRNRTLSRCLQRTGIYDVADWEELFSGKADYTVFHHQDWVSWVSERDKTGEWANWLQYVRQRYAYDIANNLTLPRR